MRIEVRIGKLVTDDLGGCSQDDFVAAVTRELRLVLARELGGPRTAAGRTSVARVRTGRSVGRSGRGRRPGRGGDVGANVPGGPGAAMTMHFRRLPGVRRHIASTVRRVLGDSGKPLSPGVRADLEPRFQADFSTVRVHADETANASARQLGARAYTVGQHIVFGRGGFAPDTAAGRELLAH